MWSEPKVEHFINLVNDQFSNIPEFQGTAEGHPFSEDEMNQMLALAKRGIAALCQRQKASLDA